MSFGRAPKAAASNGRLTAVMSCKHAEFHTVSSHYDRDRGVLVYYWTCERCGTRLKEARRDDYRPSFDPRGNDPYLAAAS
jgi:hypothetical protein